MDLTRFKQALIPMLTSDAGDSPFAALRIVTHGMAGIRTAKIINFACRCMGPKEVYFEVGTFSGFTLVSAAYQNNALCVGIDDFSMEDFVKRDSIEQAKNQVRQILKQNLMQYGGINTKFIESDFRNVELRSNPDENVGVLFVDGKHTYDEVKETIAKFEPLFANNAVLIFDDVQFGEIPKAIQELWASGQYEMLLYGVSTGRDYDVTHHMNRPLDEYLANGICVMAKKGTTNG